MAVVIPIFHSVGREAMTKHIFITCWKTVGAARRAISIILVMSTVKPNDFEVSSFFFIWSVNSLMPIASIKSSIIKQHVAGLKIHLFWSAETDQYSKLGELNKNNSLVIVEWENKNIRFKCREPISWTFNRRDRVSTLILRPNNLET